MSGWLLGALACIAVGLVVVVVAVAFGMEGARSATLKQHIRAANAHGTASDLYLVAAVVFFAAAILALVEVLY